MRRSWTAVLGTVLLASSCTSDASPAERVAEAPARTVAARTAKVTQRLEITPADGAESAEPVVVTAEGEVDFANREGRMTVSSAGEESDLVFRGSTVYQRVPEVASAAGKGWLKVDLDDLSTAVDVEGLGNLLQGQSNDPGSSLHHLRGASGDVRRVGRELMRGAATTWYETTVDVEKAAAGAPADQRAVVRQLKDTFGIARVPTDVWLDGNGRVRRLRQTIDYSTSRGSERFPAEALPERTELTLEFFDFGSPVRVQFPPPEDVADYADVLARAERGEGSGTASPATDALVPRLLPTPEGYRREPDNAGDTGPSDFEKAVRDDGARDARQVLEAQGFVAGYQRAWTRDEDGTIIQFLYQFRGPDGAAGYLERTMGSFTGEPNTDEIPVGGVPGAKGIRITEDDELTVVVLLVRGPFFGQLVVIGPDASTELPVQLARQMYDLLG